jgi:hypothetical protein
MSLEDLLAELHAAQEGHARRERHGQGELELRDDRPVRATACLLPNGSLTDAECLVPYIEVGDDTQRVWTRRLPGSALRRRGRLVVDPGKALLFVDEPAADLAAASSGMGLPTPSLERDLDLSPRIRSLVESELFATLLYGALCNTTWLHKATGTPWHCSWRHAGAVVAGLRCRGDYMDWYCSTGEGLVDEEVLAEIQELGWELAEAEPVND